MILRKADKNTEAGMMPSEELITAMGKYNEELVKAGVMLEGEGLKPTSGGARIKFKGGELIAGFTIIQVKSREEAIEWVKRWPSIDGDGEVELELRQLFELEDFGASEAVNHHAELRKQLTNR
jgi:hypothetical protein